MTLSAKTRIAIVLALFQLLFAFCPYTVLAGDLSCSTLLSSAETAFSDISPDAFCNEALLELKAAGIVNGYPDGTFQPMREITQQEYALLLSRAFEPSDTAMHTLLAAIPAQNTITYTEASRLLLTKMGVSRRIAVASMPDLPRVNKDDFSGRAGEGFLYAAHYYGILDPGVSASLNQCDYVTRGDAAVMLANALKIQDLSIPLPEQMYGIPVFFKGENAETFVHDLASGLSCFPESILSAYATSSGVITVTDEDPDNYYHFAGDINGMFWPQSEDITLFSNGHRASLLYSLEKTVRHEIGHFIYDELVSKADRTAIERMYRSEEASNFACISHYSGVQDSASEYFAELVAYMTLYGWNTACDAFSESAALVAHYLEEDLP